LFAYLLFVQMNVSRVSGEKGPMQRSAFVFYKPVVLKLFLIACRLWVLYCQNVSPCFREIQSSKYYSIKSLQKPELTQFRNKQNVMENLWPFLKPTSTRNSIKQNPISKNYSWEYIILSRKTERRPIRVPP